MMTKKANSIKDPTQKWSFLETTKRILEEEKNLTSSAAKEIPKDKTKNSSDNMVEAEPDVNHFFKPSRC